MANKKCHFNPLWLQDAEYSEWLGTVSDLTAKCTVCYKHIDLSNMGEGALKSHGKGKNHKKHLERKQKLKSSSMKLDNFFTTSAPTCRPTSSSTSDSVETDSAPRHRPTSVSPAPTCSKPTSISTSVTHNETLTAELLWCLKSQECHYSYKSSEGTGM